jgi:50S ribosomal subunit-associated GTPase HflX
LVVAPQVSAGIGGRGPGETKIETDRRRIRDKMAKLRREIAEMKVSRDTGDPGKTHGLIIFHL